MSSKLMFWQPKSLCESLLLDSEINRKLELNSSSIIEAVRIYAFYKVNTAIRNSISKVVCDIIIRIYICSSQNDKR